MPGPRTSPRAAALAILLATAVSQARADDVGDIAQIESIPASPANVLPEASRTDTVIKQRAVASGLLDSQNRAVITQFGEGNEAGITQEGTSHSAEITQDGTGNQGFIVQHDSGQAAELQQSGNGLAIKIEQSGPVAPGTPPIVVRQAN
jgi:hypothetical protein